jgi:hypothetical protein
MIMERMGDEADENRTEGSGKTGPLTTYNLELV